VSQTGSASGAVTSRDGTVVAYDVQGDGPPVVLVAAALSDRGDMKRMSAATGIAATIDWFAQPRGAASPRPR